MSDTHDYIPNVRRAIRIFLGHNVEHIIHLGDIISPFIPRIMKEELSDSDLMVTAVLGNNDGDVYLLSKLFNEYKWRLLPGPSILEIDGRKIFLMHGFNGIDFTEKLAYSLVKILDIDILLYGHTHRVKKEYVDQKLLLNPGETCGYLTGKSSIALLDTSDLSIKIIEL